MKIFAYLSSTDDTPGGQWVARIWHDKERGFHPVLFAGQNEGSVRLAAEVWWDDTLGGTKARPPKKKKPMEAPTGAPATEEVGDVL